MSGGVHFHYVDDRPTPAPEELPRGIGHFVNRVRAIEDLDGLLSDTPERRSGAVYVISGTAGVGKTSLAVHWAHRVSDQFPDGQLYINLRGYDPGAPATADEALERFLQSLGVPAQKIPTSMEQKASLYRSIVSKRRILIVLDNAVGVTQVRPLLPGGRNTVAVITSRSQLSGLFVRDDAIRSTVDVLSEEDALDLLGTAMHEFRGTDDLADVAELARLCSFLPLALRVAAERAASRPHMPLADLIQDLRDESALWEALSIDDQDELSAVRSVFAWSYRALPKDAAQLFCLLGLHPVAQFSSHAAAALLGLHADRVRHRLDVLVGANLLDSPSFGRYQFHDLLRAYAVNCARDDVPQAEQDAARRRECVWYLHTVYACAMAIAHDTTLVVALEAPPEDVHPLTFPSTTDAARWYDEERTALVAIVRTAVALDQPRIVWRMASLLERIYSSYHHLRDWRITSELGLEIVRAHNDHQGEAVMCESLGRWSRLTMRLTEAIGYHRAAADANLAHGDIVSAAKTFNGLGWGHLFGHQLVMAYDAFVRSLDLSQQADEPFWVATACYGLGYTCLQLERPAEAGIYLTKSLKGFAALGDRLYEALVLSAWSMLERDVGLVDAALMTAQKAVDISREMANDVWEATTLLYLGKAQRAVGKPDEALVSYQRAAVIGRQVGDTSREAIALEGAGCSYQDLGRPVDAIAFHRRAAATHRELGDEWKVAQSLLHLATATEGLDQHDAAEVMQYRRQAAQILSGYDDPKSRRRYALSTE